MSTAITSRLDVMINHSTDPTLSLDPGATFKFVRNKIVVVDSHGGIVATYHKKSVLSIRVVSAEPATVYVNGREIASTKKVAMITDGRLVQVETGRRRIRVYKHPWLSALRIRIGDTTQYGGMMK